MTSGYKWLRAVARGEFTGLHCDRVYLGRGSRALLTAWLPLGRVPTGRGSLLVARGSHRLRAFDALHTGYGTSEVGTTVCDAVSADQCERPSSAAFVCIVSCLEAQHACTWEPQGHEPSATARQWFAKLGTVGHVMINTTTLC